MRRKPDGLAKASSLLAAAGSCLVAGGCNLLPAPGPGQQLGAPALIQPPRVYHCHVLEHEDKGMMALLQVDS